MRKESKKWGASFLVVQWLSIHLQCGGRGFDLWCRKLSQALTCGNEACEPQLLKPGCPRPCARQQEKPEHCNEEQPLCATTRESLCTAVKTHYSQKQIKKIEQRVDTCICITDSLCYTAETSIVNQLYSNTFLKTRLYESI